MIGIDIYQKDFIEKPGVEEGQMVKHPVFLPQQSTGQSAGLDVSTPYPFTLKVGERHMVDTGLIIKPPRDHCILVLPRSGLSCKHGISIPNAPGLIDRDYCGPTDFIGVTLVNNGPEDFEFEAGDRVAQLLFTKYVTPQWRIQQQADFARPESRGGFGSTGLERKS